MAGIESFIKKVCVQPAVYWERLGLDGFGKAIFAAPVQVWVRWEEKTEVIKDKTGKDMVISATILTPTDMKELSMVKLGYVQELHDNDPYKWGAAEIQQYEKIPLFKRANAFVRKAYVGEKGL